MTEAPELDLTAVAPLLSVAMGAVLVLLAELGLGGRSRLLGRAVTPGWMGTLITLMGAASLTVAALFAAQGFGSGDVVSFNPAHPLLRLDALARFASVGLCLAAALVCLLAKDSLPTLRIPPGEYTALLLLATAGMLVLVGAADLLGLLLGLTLSSLPLQALAGSDRRSLRANESALKLMLLGGFALAVSIYGLALVYGATGTTGYGELRQSLPEAGPLAPLGLALVLVGPAFLMSAVPFHGWAPDAQEGAPTAASAFLTLAPQAAAAAALLRLLVEAVAPPLSGLQPALGVLALLSLALGSLLALVQEDLKRLLACVGIAQAGLLLVGFTVATPAAWSALLFASLAHGLGCLGVVAVMLALAHRGREATQLSDLAALAHSRPGLAALLGLFVLSLAGAPGTAGFIARFELLLAAVAEGRMLLALATLAASAVLLAALLRILFQMIRGEGEGEPGDGSVTSAEGIVLAVCAAGVLLFGLVPGGVEGLPLLPELPALDWVRHAVSALGGTAG